LQKHSPSLSLEGFGGETPGYIGENLRCPELLYAAPEAEPPALEKVETPDQRPEQLPRRYSGYFGGASPASGASTPKSSPPPASLYVKAAKSPGSGARVTLQQQLQLTATVTAATASAHLDKLKHAILGGADQAAASDSVGCSVSRSGSDSDSVC